MAYSHLSWDISYPERFYSKSSSAPPYQCRENTSNYAANHFLHCRESIKFYHKPLPSTPGNRLILRHKPLPSMPGKHFKLRHKPLPSMSGKHFKLCHKPLPSMSGKHFKLYHKPLPSMPGKHFKLCHKPLPSNYYSLIIPQII